MKISEDFSNMCEELFIKRNISTGVVKGLTAFGFYALLMASIGLFFNIFKSCFNKFKRKKTC